MNVSRLERLVVLLVGTVQFVNILDFVMVMPLGPDFSRALAIDVSRLGYLGGSYTAAAAASGLLLSPYLDRLDRRVALTLSMLGLAVGTGLGALATGMYSLLAARIVAGLFGGPATSMALAIIADVVPVERRGRAMGSVMGAFSVAQVLGVPIGLWAARVGDWRTPFWGLGLVGAAVTLACGALLPPLRGHLAEVEKRERSGRDLTAALFDKSEVRWSYAMTAVVMASGFSIIPNISAYVQGNLGYPRSDLEKLYMIGGVCSYVAMRGAGALVDKTRPLLPGTLGVIGFALTTLFFFVVPWLPVLGFFVVFMVAMACRNVAHQTLASRVPGAAERGRFMSIQSAIGHLAAATGAIGSSHLLRSRPNGSLENIAVVATIAILLGLLIPIAMWIVESRLRARATEHPA